MSTPFTKNDHRHPKTMLRGPLASSMWLKIASTPAYCDMAGMSSREPARTRDRDVDPLEPQMW